MSQKNPFAELLNGIIQPTGNNAWWQAFSYPQIPSFREEELISLPKTALFFQSFLSGNPVFSAKVEAEIKLSPEDFLKEVQEGLVRLGFSLKFRGTENNFTNDFYSHDTGAISLRVQEYPSMKDLLPQSILDSEEDSIHGNRHMVCEIVSTNSSLNEKVIFYLDSFKA